MNNWHTESIPRIQSNHIPILGEKRFQKYRFWATSEISPFCGIDELTKTCIVRLVTCGAGSDEPIVDAAIQP